MTPRCRDFHSHTKFEAVINVQNHLISHKMNDRPKKDTYTIKNDPNELEKEFSKKKHIYWL